MKRIVLIGIWFGVVLAGCGRNDEDRPLEKVLGTKYPNSAEEGTVPIKTYAIVTRDLPSGFGDLVPYILRSPDQDEAGSCLYMAHTGIAEWWLARLNPTVSRAPDGPIDLSERYLMNLEDNDITNWRTDTIYLLNRHDQKAALNRSYRFTKGWYKEDSSEHLVRAKPHESGSSYGTSYNWIDERASIVGDLVSLPHFKRDVIFADPTSNQWNMGVAPRDIIETVKGALSSNRAPVLVIYNHMSYWHAVFIVGYSDTQSSGNCSFVEKTRQHFVKKLDEDRNALAAATTDEERTRLRAQLDKDEKLRTNLENGYEAGGGCRGKGVFFVRDSIYEDPDGPMYDYDPTQRGEEAHYNKTVILREYEWLEYLANHIVQIGVE